MSKDQGKFDLCYDPIHICSHSQILKCSDIWPGRSRWGTVMRRMDRILSFLKICVKTWSVNARCARLCVALATLSILWRIPVLGKNVWVSIFNKGRNISRADINSLCRTFQGSARKGGKCQWKVNYDFWCKISNSLSGPEGKKISAHRRNTSSTIF